MHIVDNYNTTTKTTILKATIKYPHQHDKGSHCHQCGQVRPMLTLRTVGIMHTKQNYKTVYYTCPNSTSSFLLNDTREDCMITCSAKHFISGSPKHGKISSTRDYTFGVQSSISVLESSCQQLLRKSSTD